MLGTIVNFLAIVIGSIMGILIKNNIPERFKTSLNNAIGLCVVFIGISGAVSKLILPNTKPILFIISLVVGTFIGELLQIDNRLNNFGLFIEKRFKNNDGKFAQGFVSSSLVFCVGTMAIIGSIQSGIENNHSVLFAKSVLDGVSSIIFASVMGVGVLFSAFSVFVYQGFITLFAKLVAPHLSEQIINEISIVGGILIFALGLNLLNITKIKIANLLPSVFIPVIYLLFHN